LKNIFRRRTLNLAIGADERTSLTDFIVLYLRQKGHNTKLFGPLGGGSMNWSDVAQRVAEDVVNNESDEGVLLCWTGTGVSIAANKVPGIRAALCGDTETSRGARLWNNANVLCLSIRNMTEASVEEILDVWFDTKYVSNPEDDFCLERVRNIEDKYLSTNKN